MKKGGKTVGGYNVQIAVDEKHKLIVAEQVTQDGNDKKQLEPMMSTAAETLGNDELKGLADTGYHSAEQLDACEQKGFEVVVAEPKHASHQGRDGRFGRDDFEYDAEADVYLCPADEKLRRGGLTRNKNKQYVTYRATTAQCQSCSLREQCLLAKARYRKIQRSIHEAAVERNRERLKGNPKQARDRSSIVEHPFGTFKHNWQMSHFMMRSLPKCQGEFSLMALSYNFKRVLNLVGFEALMSYCAQMQRIRLNFG